MSDASVVQKIKEGGQDVADAASPTIEKLARLGYATKGAVYILLGILSGMAAIGAGGKTTDAEGVLKEIFQQKFGGVLLAIMALGLMGYSLWRFVQAIWDPEHRRSDWKRYVSRVAFFSSGAVHASLALAACGMLLNYEDGGGDAAQEKTRQLMQQPFGRWLVGFVGFCIAAAALVQFYRAYSGKFRDRLMTGGTNAAARRMITVVGRVGLSAYGVVLGLIGCFLISAAIKYDSGEAGGVGDALHWIGSQSYGPWLLAAVAAGLIAYGLFELVKAKYRWIRTP
jgi:hypothetical protein